MDKVYSYEDFLEIVKTLRSPNGCPWDKVQTYESLRPCMIEEAYEFLASVRILKETGSYENMREELGDLLLQVVMNSQIASEEGLFTMEDVIQEISEKMIRRHPHVFGDMNVNNAQEVVTNWDEIKKKEKADKAWMETPLREIPKELPALARAPKIMKKVNKLYEAPKTYSQIIEEMEESLQRLKKRGEEIDSNQLSDEMGTLLISISNLAALRKIYAEQILTDRIEKIIVSYEPKSGEMA